MISEKISKHGTTCSAKHFINYHNYEKKFLCVTKCTSLYTRHSFPRLRQAARAAVPHHVRTRYREGPQHWNQPVCPDRTRQPFAHNYRPTQRNFYKEIAEFDNNLFIFENWKWLGCGNSFFEKMIHDLLKSHNFLKIGKKR